jgi:hypothetical protein
VSDAGLRILSLTLRVMMKKMKSTIGLLAKPAGTNMTKDFLNNQLIEWAERQKKEDIYKSLLKEANAMDEWEAEQKLLEDEKRK